MYTVYAIYNRKHDKFYIGQTNDLLKRIKFHNDRLFKGCYTSRFNGKWELIYQEKAATCQEALKREKQLKSFRGREYIKRYIPR